MDVPPVPQHPPKHPGRPKRSRTRRLFGAGALLSAATLGTVFSVQAMASDGSTPPGYERPEPPALAHPAEGGLSHEHGDKGPGKGGRWSMVIVTKATDADKAKAAAVDFSQCMRDNGVQNFPDIKVTDAGDGRVRLELSGSGKHMDPHAKKFEKAHKTCAPIMEKAGVDLPEAPLPPGAPGKHGKHEGPSLHQEHHDDAQAGTSVGT